jgi:hypothetical protein
MNISQHKEALRMSYQNPSTEVYVLFDGGNYRVSLLDAEDFGVEGYEVVAVYMDGRKIHESEH